MKKYFIFTTLSIFVLGLFLASWNIPVSASPNYQLTPFPIPTPGGDGRIWYKVQPGDTLWRISAVTGISLDELRRLNNMAPDDVLVEGGIILLGVSQLSIPTSTSADPEQEIVQPTETPVIDTGSAIICIVLYEDINGDALRQESEGIIEDGAVSLTEQTGLFSETRNTSIDEEEYCFEGLPGGKYNITMAIPDGYNPTSTLTLTLELLAGDSSLINFGAQKTYQTQNEDLETANSGAAGSPALGILGVSLLLGGIGLGIYTSQMGRKS